MRLYVSQPFDDSIVVIDVGIGGTSPNQLFVTTGRRVMRSRAFNRPVDLAPVMIENEDPNWSSNTTLEEGSDFYVCNRGDGTIVRMRQDGTVVAIRRVHVTGFGAARLNGIAAAPDRTKLWVTYTGGRSRSGDHSGGVIELPSF
jgi:hypothetical protein